MKTTSEFTDTGTDITELFDGNRHVGAVYIEPFDLICHNNALFAAHRKRSPIRSYQLTESMLHSPQIVPWQVNALPETAIEDASTWLAGNNINTVISPMGLHNNPTCFKAGRIVMMAVLRTARREKNDMLVLERRPPSSTTQGNWLAIPSLGSREFAIRTLQTTEAVNVGPIQQDQLEFEQVTLNTATYVAHVISGNIGLQMYSSYFNAIDQRPAAISGTGDMSGQSYDSFESLIASSAL